MCQILLTGGRAWAKHLVNLDGSSNDPMCVFTIIFQHFMFSMVSVVTLFSSIFEIARKFVVLPVEGFMTACPQEKGRQKQAIRIMTAFKKNNDLQCDEVESG